MKIKSIAAICAKSKRAYIYEGPGGSQFIGNGYAVYPLLGLPRMHEDSILTLFDVPDSKKDNWIVNALGMPEGMNLSDTSPSEEPAEESNILIVYEGRELLPVMTKGGEMVFINRHYLNPLADERTLELYARRDGRGQIYIVAKTGLYFKAAILPAVIKNDAFLGDMVEIVNRYEAGLRLRQADDAEDEYPGALRFRDDGEIETESGEDPEE